MAISAPRDANRVPVAMGTLQSDGLTVALLYAVAATHRLKISNGTTGSNIASVNAQRDANRVTALWATSSADGTTPIPLYVTASNQLLTKSS